MIKGIAAFFLVSIICLLGLLAWHFIDDYWKAYKEWKKIKREKQRHVLEKKNKRRNSKTIK